MAGHNYPDAQREPQERPHTIVNGAPVMQRTKAADNAHPIGTRFHHRSPTWTPDGYATARFSAVW